MGDIWERPLTIVLSPSSQYRHTNNLWQIEVNHLIMLHNIPIISLEPLTDTSKIKVNDTIWTLLLRWYFDKINSTLYKLCGITETICSYNLISWKITLLPHHITSSWYTRISANQSERLGEASFDQSEKEKATSSLRLSETLEDKM